MESLNINMPIRIEVGERTVVGNIEIKDITIKEYYAIGSLTKEFIKSLEELNWNGDI